MEIANKPLLPRPVIFGVIALLLVGLGIGATFYHFIEGLGVIDSFYFAAMTLTTVGYGDFVPKTDIGKIFTAVYAFTGVGIFLGFAAMFSQAAFSRIHRAHMVYQKNHKKQL